MRIAIILVLLARVAAAEPVVLAVDKGTIYIELGARDGVGAGTQVELLHAVTVKDPRTGQMLRDHFALGTLEVVKSGETISVARAEGELAARVIAGDRVRIISTPRKFEDPWKKQVANSKGMAAPPPVAPPRPGVDSKLDHADLVRAAWLDTLGKAPEHRIERWAEALKADPHGPYRAAIQAEIGSLKIQIANRDAALARAKSSRSDDRAPRIAALAQAVAGSSERMLAMAAIEHALPGKPIQLAFLVRTPGAFKQAWLYVQPAGESGFKRVAMSTDGDAYLRGTIDESLVRGEQVQWYVELVAANGETFEAYGSRESPERIALEQVVTDAPIRTGRSHINLHVDYVDFDGQFNKGFDQYYLAEADFTYRFIDPVYAVRLGFGTMSGTGGPKDIIDLETNCMDESGTFRCRQVEFSYVYTELEFRLRKNVALMIRPQAGLLTTDTSANTAAGRCRGSNVDGCQFFTGLGARARLRLGEETGTNLVLGAGFTENVGTLLEAAYTFLAKRSVPVQLTVQVTDMPVPEDFGVRLIGDIGWRSREIAWFYPSLRLSYQARDIDHAGVSGGLAMNFDW